jgi:hypothetical protein
MKIKSQKDFFSGFLFMAGGVFFAWCAFSAGLGHAEGWGAGNLSLWSGLLLILLGVVITFKSLVLETDDGGRLGEWAWRPLCLALLGLFLFGFLLGGWPELGLAPMGLVVAIFVLCLVLIWVDPGFSWHEPLLLATVLSLFCIVGLVVGLQLPWSIWPNFMVGAGTWS